MDAAPILLMPCGWWSELFGRECDVSDVVEQFEALIKAEWLKTVSGTYSEADFKIFSNGFRKGYVAARKYEGCQHDWDNEHGTTFCRNCRVVQKETINERK